jgi:dienelactone hydrolase
MLRSSVRLSRRHLLAVAPALALAPAAHAAVARIEVREAGLVGTLFLPALPAAQPAVISLTGALGGIWEEPAQALAGEGFACLALATHNAPGKPAALSRIPLDDIDAAITLLRNRVQPRDGLVALRGWSRGGEAALALASLSSNVSAVLAYAPRCYVGREQNKQNSFDDPTAAPAWMWRGLPVVGETLPPEMRPDLRQQSFEDWFGIAVERIKGPIMLVCGEIDTGIAGTTAIRSATYAMHRLDLLHSRVRRTLLHYPDAGHDIAGPPPYQGGAEGGGTIDGDAAAIIDSWPRAVAFLRSLTSN